MLRQRFLIILASLAIACFYIPRCANAQKEQAGTWPTGIATFGMNSFFGFSLEPFVGVGVTDPMRNVRLEVEGGMVLSSVHDSTEGPIFWQYGAHLTLNPLGFWSKRLMYIETGWRWYVHSAGPYAALEFNSMSDSTSTVGGLTLLAGRNRESWYASVGCAVHFSFPP